MRIVNFVVPVLVALVLRVDPAQGQGASPAERGRSPWLVSLAGGTVTEGPFGIGPEVNAHGMVALSYARAGWPVELRGDLLARSSVNQAGQVALNASAVVPLARLAVGRASLRPYALAGVGASQFAAAVPRFAQALGYHVGAGARLEGEHVGLFSELRRHSVYRRSFLSVGVGWRL
jgi:hypothetical protein